MIRGPTCRHSALLNCRAGFADCRFKRVKPSNNILHGVIEVGDADLDLGKGRGDVDNFPSFSNHILVDSVEPALEGVVEGIDGDDTL